MKVNSAQLALEMRLRDDATFENFLCPAQLQPAVRLLQEQGGSQGEPLIYLAGSSGSGKSHLLQACCQDSSEVSLYLPLRELMQFSAEDVVQGMEAQSRLCLDDVQLIAGSREWELGLFNLINRARQSGCRLVMAAAEPPRGLNVALPDLASRLSGGVVFQLPRPDDEAKAAILRHRAQRRGLVLSQQAADFIVARAPRELDQLLLLLDELDRASLAEKRPLSIPFVKLALNW